MIVPLKNVLHIACPRDIPARPAQFAPLARPLLANRRARVYGAPQWSRSRFN